MTSWWAASESIAMSASTDAKSGDSGTASSVLGFGTSAAAALPAEPPAGTDKRGIKQELTALISRLRLDDVLPAREEDAGDAPGMFALASRKNSSDASFRTAAFELSIHQHTQCGPAEVGAAGAEAGGATAEAGPAPIGRS